jgi:Bacterial capsule synthesis protein PGA_cap
MYGYPREPEATDVDPPANYVPYQRVSSEPVAVPGSSRVAELPPFEPLPEPPVEPPLQVPAEPESEISPVTHTLPARSATATGSASVATGVVSVAAIPRQPAGESLNGGSGSAGVVTEAPPEPVPVRKVEPAPVPGEELEADSAALDVVPEIPPWDRKALMIVIASAAALVVLAIISGIITVAVAPVSNRAEWRDAGTRPSAGATSPAPAVPPPPPANDTVTFSGVGDVIMGSAPGNLPPNNGSGFFDPVKEALAADLVMGNLETPLSEPTGYSKCGDPPTEGCFQFSLPPSYANHLRDGGFQVLNLANNHTNDMGSQGLANTRDALTAAGLQHTGGVGQITNVTVKGVTVAVLGFSVYSWGASLNNIEAATALVKQAAAQADLVVIQMQGGAEGSDKTHVRVGHEIFLGEDRGDLITFSHAMVDAGADVVFGHGPHIMRGMEFYKGRLIAYSLGNFCGYRVLGTAGFLGVGGVLKVTLHKDGTWAGGKLVPTEMINGGIASPDDDKRALAFVAGLSREDFPASAPTISTTDGTISPPAAS